MGKMWAGAKKELSRLAKKKVRTCVLMRAVSRVQLKTHCSSDFPTNQIGLFVTMGTVCTYVYVIVCVVGSRIQY